jgi:hypothetical protein
MFHQRRFSATASTQNDKDLSFVDLEYILKDGIVTKQLSNAQQ